MSHHDSLGDRMKGYELASRTVLPRRMPLILRVDGKAFHTYTKQLPRFHEGFADLMIATATALCEEIQGAQLAYTQSDEISVLIHGYKTFDTSPWFDNQVQKIVSVAASTAAGVFSSQSWKVFSRYGRTPPSDLADTLASLDVAISTKDLRWAAFDARVAAYPEHDVCNYFVWRQQDALRNSIQMLAQSLFSQKQLDRQDQHAMKKMCLERGQDWDQMSTRWKQGVCIVREKYMPDMPELATEGIAQGKLPRVLRSRWIADLEIPLFSSYRAYIETHLATEDEAG